MTKIMIMIMRVDGLVLRSDRGCLELACKSMTANYTSSSLPSSSSPSSPSSSSLSSSSPSLFLFLSYLLSSYHDLVPGSKCETEDRKPGAEVQIWFQKWSTNRAQRRLSQPTLLKSFKQPSKTGRLMPRRRLLSFPSSEPGRAGRAH